MSYDAVSNEASVAPADSLLKRGRGSVRRHVLAASVIALCGLTLALIPALAQAEPRTINDCEKIQEADAYNQCLASFGPVAHERGTTSDPEGGGGHGGGQAMSRAAASAEPARGRHGGGRYRHGWRGGGSHHAASAKKADPWANMRHAGGGRHRAEFKVR